MSHSLFRSPLPNYYITILHLDKVLLIYNYNYIFFYNEVPYTRPTYQCFLFHRKLRHENIAVVFGAVEPFDQRTTMMLIMEMGDNNLYNAAVKLVAGVAPDCLSQC